MGMNDRLPSQGHLLAALILAAVGSASCGRQPPHQADTRAADVAAIRELHDRATRAQNSGDAAALSQNSVSDVLVLPPDGSLVAGRDAYLRLNQAFYDKFTGLFDNKTDEIVVSGDWGFDRGTYRYTQTPKAGGATVVIEGNYLWLARREPDGAWRVARITWNVRPPPVVIEDR